MTFENQYLTYSEYQELGGTLQELPFNELEFEVRKIIDEKTQNRLKDVTTIPDEVKLCEYRMINVVNSYQETSVNTQSGIVSETIDGYSVSYNNTQTIISSKHAELEDIVSTSLFGVIVNNEHLIYLGVK